MRQPPRHRFVLTALALACVISAVAAVSLQAQAVTGQVVAADDGRPIAGAFVILHDADGRRHSAVLTGSDGRYLLRAPAPGRYSLRVEQIGFESVDSPLLELSATTVQYPFVVPVQAVLLPGLMVEASSRCGRHDDGAAVHTLWDEIRKALDVAAFTDQADALRYNIVQHVTEVDATGSHILRDERRPRVLSGRLPYQAGGDAGTLVSDGFLRMVGDTSVLLGPDATVLLSPEFSDAYCFRIVAGAEDDSVGLGFEPADRQRDITSIRGVLWVDRATARLDRLEYSYLDLPAPLTRHDAGGDVSFQRLPDGRWIVGRWSVRSPLVALDEYTRSTHVVGTRGDGGTVLTARQRGEVLYEAAGTGVITGRVHDDAWDAPQAGTVVGLAGTPWFALTDSTGSYRMDGVPPGRYHITAISDWMVELHTPAAMHGIVVREHETVNRDLDTAAFADAMQRRCPDTPPGSRRLVHGVIYGAAYDPDTGQPLSGVTVRAEYGRSRTDVETDAAGRYAICWLPRSRDVPVHVQLVTRPHRTARLAVMLTRPLIRQDFH